MDAAVASLHLVEVFRSPRVAECDQQSLILAAVGIHSWTIFRDGIFVVLVTEDFYAAALRHITEAAREAAVPPPAPRVAISHPRAWTGSLIYALLLMAVAYAAGTDLFGYDWLDAGALEGIIPSSHEWWRIITALTLHADVGHLVGNLVFGVILGYFAARSLGTGVAWASILLGAMMGNALDALWMPDDQSSIGASTAVFATLGLLSAYAWTFESAAHLQWAKRWAPLIAGVILLAFTGAGGERTDVVAHISGFASGCLLGALYGKMPQERFDSRWVQLVAALLALATLGAAWLFSLPGARIE
jgi:membrane associated rhomboid family serine protease